MSLVSEAHRRHWQQRRRCVEGLPADALFAAMHQVDQLQRDVADPELLIPVDLVRLEALPEHWQQRIRERARLLLP